MPARRASRSASRRSPSAPRCAPSPPAPSGCRPAPCPGAASATSRRCAALHRRGRRSSSTAGSGWWTTPSGSACSIATATTWSTSRACAPTASTSARCSRSTSSTADRSRCARPCGSSTDRRLVELGLVRPGGEPVRRAHRRRLPRRAGALMALYVSARKRRTRAVIAAVVVGLLAFGVGLLIGRQQVPSVGDRIAAVQTRRRRRGHRPRAPRRRVRQGPRRHRLARPGRARADRPGGHARPARARRRSVDRPRAQRAAILDALAQTRQSAVAGDPQDTFVGHLQDTAALVRSTFGVTP